MPQRSNAKQKSKLEIAALAAKLIATEGASDFQTAKMKAASDIGYSSKNGLPSNLEIETALINYQSLFQSESRSQHLHYLRSQALKAMELLSMFKPLLTGPVAKGTATSSSEIVIHLYHDEVERVALYLNEKGIPTTSTERQMRINTVQTVIKPALRFLADKASVVIVVFSEKDKNLNILSSIDNREMCRVNILSLRNLIAESELLTGLRN